MDDVQAAHVQWIAHYLKPGAIAAAIEHYLVRILEGEGLDFHLHYLQLYSRAKEIQDGRLDNQP